MNVLWLTREEKIEILLDMAFEIWQDSSTFDQQKVRELASIVLDKIEREE